MHTYPVLFHHQWLQAAGQAEFHVPHCQDIPLTSCSMTGTLGILWLHLVQLKRGFFFSSYFGPMAIIWFRTLSIIGSILLHGFVCRGCTGTVYGIPRYFCIRTKKDRMLWPSSVFNTRSHIQRGVIPCIHTFDMNWGNILGWWWMLVPFIQIRDHGATPY